MKKLLASFLLIYKLFFLVLFCFASCKKTEDPIKFPQGTFPDSTIALNSINSGFDDLDLTNIDLVLDETDEESYLLHGDIFALLSTNRENSGEQFDLIQCMITFEWDQTDGTFTLNTNTGNNTFIEELTGTANTPMDDLGPYRRFSSFDGYEYLILSSENTSGNLDIFYLMNMPVTWSFPASVMGPYPVNLINTVYNDSYFCFDTSLDSAYFSSDREGNYDIYLNIRPPGTAPNTWFDSDFEAAQKVDSLNSNAEDNCPMVYKRLMVFASNREGGMGGYDLYYSKFENGKWNSPVNFGPGINTSHDEFRPVIGTHADFSNHFIIFSSNRPGNSDSFNLYFAGIDI